jgi:CRISPR-associated protein Cas2
MYVVLVYDIEQERVGRVCKYLRRHLTWVQNSVFEGELTKAQITKVRNGLNRIIKEERDSVITYIMRDAKWVQRETMGVEKSPTTNII